MRALLLFAEEEVGRIEGWLRLADGGVVARGSGIDHLPPPLDDERLILLLPGPETTLRWLDIATATDAQALAAARLALADRSIAPVDQLHVAIGAVHAGARLVAAIAQERIADWLAWATDQGLDPDHIVPLPLLIAYGDGPVRLWERKDHVVVRGHHRAFAIEADLVDTILGDEVRERIDDARFQAELPAALDLLPLDLRQGAYRRRRRLAVDAGWRARMIRYAVAAVILIVLIPIVRLAHIEYDAWRLRSEAAEVAQATLGLPERPDDPRGALAQRLHGLQGPGMGFVDGAAILFGAVRQTPNVQLGAIAFDDTGVLTAEVSAAPADLAELVRRVASSGMIVEAGGGPAGMASLRISRP